MRCITLGRPNCVQSTCPRSPHLQLVARGANNATVQVRSSKNGGKALLEEKSTSCYLFLYFALLSPGFNPLRDHPQPALIGWVNFFARGLPLLRQLATFSAKTFHRRWSRWGAVQLQPSPATGTPAPATGPGTRPHTGAPHGRNYTDKRRGASGAKSVVCAFLFFFFFVKIFVCVWSFKQSGWCYLAPCIASPQPYGGGACVRGGPRAGC